MVHTYIYIIYIINESHKLPSKFMVEQMANYTSFGGDDDGGTYRHGGNATQNNVPYYYSTIVVTLHLDYGTQK